MRITPGWWIVRDRRRGNELIPVFVTTHDEYHINIVRYPNTGRWGELEADYTKNRLTFICPLNLEELAKEGVAS